MIKVHSCLTVRCCRTETIRSIALVSTSQLLLDQRQRKSEKSRAGEGLISLDLHTIFFIP